jgi:hypothetical protein
VLRPTVSFCCRFPRLWTRQPLTARTDTFPKTNINGQLSADWETIRETENHYSHGPVTDVSSEAIRCYELNPGTGAPKIAGVQAGSNVTFTVDSNIGHPGPLQFYMAKVPAGKTAATFDGKGAVWFKIYQDGPSGLGTSTITWPSSGSFIPPSSPIPPFSSSVTPTNSYHNL